MTDKDKVQKYELVIEALLARSMSHYVSERDMLNDFRKSLAAVRKECEE